MLLGGAGDDHLNGGYGRDILIGGDGMDRLVGNRDEDVLIGDRSGYESDPSSQALADDTALLGFLAEWGGTDERADREQALDALVASIMDDGAEDRLTGSTGEDWFFDSPEDIFTDSTSNGTGGKGRNN